MANYDAPVMYRWKEPNAPPNFPALAVYFLEESVLNVEVTAETGIQSYDSVEMAYVAPIGNSKSNASCEMKRTLPDGTERVHNGNMQRYGEPYRLWKQGATAESQGTPLKELLGINPATIMNLKVRGFHTVEMLADANDTAGQDVMGFWEWRDRARKHLEHRKEQAPLVRMTAMEAKYEADKADSQRKIDELTALVAELTSGKRGPGRPRKDEAAEAA